MISIAHARAFAPACVASGVFGALSMLLRRVATRPWLVLGLMRAESDDTHIAVRLVVIPPVKLDQLK